MTAWEWETAAYEAVHEEWIFLVVGGWLDEIGSAQWSRVILDWVKDGGPPDVRAWLRSWIVKDTARAIDPDGEV